MEQSLYLKTAISAVRAAEKIIRRYWDDGFDVRLKADESPVTEADIEAERAIRQVIQEQFPSHGFYGEEMGSIRRDAEYSWLIDPIDGTKSFIRRTPFFSTQVALMKGNQIILGVSNAPLYGEMAWAEKGHGAFMNGHPVRVGKVTTLNNAALSLGNIKTLAQGTGWQGLGKIVSGVNRTRGYGDFCHYHMLAAGQVDLVIESDLNILDVAALSVIVEEAGGVITSLDGRQLGLEAKNVLAAATPELHELAREYLRVN
ncbi:inositol monophosphatase family protein [Acidihalobacter prosperus]